MLGCWFEVDRSWQTLDPWLEPVPANTYANVKAIVPPGKLLAIVSDNDPFTSDWKRNQQLWEERLNAKVVVVPGGKHFNEKQEPVVLTHVKGLFGL